MRTFRTAALLAAALLLAPMSACEATKPVPTPESALASAGDRHWEPRPGLRWQIQLTGPFVDTIAANVYDLDPYTTTEDRLTDLRAQGRQTMCHLDLGASDMALPDAHRIPRAALGGGAGNGRRWLDIRDWAGLAPVIGDRLTLCQTKGFDAVDADTASAYPGVSRADQLTFDQRVAELAHRVGLKVGVRTPPALAAQAETFTDFGVTTSCFSTPDCDNFFVFVRAHKAVFDVEITSAGEFCPLARAYGIAATKSSRAMDGYTQPCG